MNLLHRHVNLLTDRYPKIDQIKVDLEEAALLLARAVASGRKILTCGNGGSAADAEHIVGELVKSFSLKRLLPPEDVEKMRALYPDDADDILSNLEGAIPAISLASSVAFATAFANDVCYEYGFAQHLYALGAEGDVLIAISTSGNSKNVVNAARVAKFKGVKVLALTGATGGELAALADVCVKAPAGKVHEIQEMHLPIYHFLCFYLEQIFFTNEGADELAEIRAGKGRTGKSIKKTEKRRIEFRPELVVFDFDGVFTDNQVLTLQDGTEGVFCTRSDGLGLSLLRDIEIPMMILSTEQNPVVQARAKKLKLECISGCNDKRQALEQVFKERKINPNHVVFVGNDINDMEAMRFVGFSVVPADAHPSVKYDANLILRSKGGYGTVRELCELLYRELRPEAGRENL